MEPSLDQIQTSWISSSKHPIDALKALGLGTFSEYAKEAGLANLINGKTIAYVGPASNIAGKQMGKFIDGHDIVIRAGQMAPLPKGAFDDYGSRTDILVHSFNHWEIAEAQKHSEYYKTLKYVVCSMVSHDFHVQHNAFFDNLRSHGIMVHKPDDTYLYKLFNDVGTTCNCGFMGLLILLNYDIKSIYITGMDFYNMGRYGNVYRSDYYDMVTDAGNFRQNNEKQFDAADARADLHNQPQQIAYLKQLAANDKRILLDEYLTANLGVPMQNKQTYQ
ncbi:MAG: hypothetical protein EXR21_09160 [Flavobacteriaceae bacterium]|nr:hypothetical protein [Flavobacteriaceae bacterium]